MLTVLIMGATALASGFFAQVGDPQDLGSGGTWARALRIDGAWKLAYATNGDYFLDDLERTDFNTFVLERGDQVQLTDNGTLKDHAVKRCPDGTWLHLASGAIEVDNDAAFAFHYTADFELLAEAVVDQDDSIPHNDMPHVCSRLLEGAAFPGEIVEDTEGPSQFFHLDRDLQVTGITEFPGNPRAQGGALLTEPDRDVILLLGFNHGGPMGVVELSPDLEELSRREVWLLEDPIRAYWPQGVMRVGPYYLVAFMGRDDDAAAVDNGNVYLAVFDAEWELLQQEQLTDYHESEGAMRPWLSRADEQLLVTFDRENGHYALEIELDLSAFGVSADAPDTGRNPDELVDTGSVDDTGDSGDPDSGDPDSGEPGGEESGSTGGFDEANPPADVSSSRCGCGAAGSAIWLLGAVVLGRRRR